MLTCQYNAKFDTYQVEAKYPVCRPGLVFDVMKPIVEANGSVLRGAFSRVGVPRKDERMRCHLELHAVGPRETMDEAARYINMNAEEILAGGDKDRILGINLWVKEQAHRGIRLVGSFSVADQPYCLASFTEAVSEAAGSIMSLTAESVPDGRFASSTNTFRIDVGLIVADLTQAYRCRSNLERWCFSDHVGDTFSLRPVESHVVWPFSELVRFGSGLRYRPAA